MSDIPTGWERRTLGDLGRYLNGRAFKSSEWGAEGRPIIRIQNLTGSGSDFNYFSGEVEDRYIVHPGDLLVSWAATLGAYFWTGPEGVLNQHIFKVESNIDKRFHKYLIDSKIPEMMSQTHGSGMVHITKSKFDAVPVAIPPLDEQRRIVAILEDHLSRLDAGSIGVRRAIAFSGRLRRALLQGFLVSAVPEAAGRTVRLGDLVDNLDRQRVPVSASERAKRPGDVPYFGATGQVGNIDSALFDEDLILLGEDGVQFFDPDKPKAYAISGPAWVNNHAHVLRPKPDAVDADFLLHSLNAFDYRGYANGTTRLKLTQAAMNRIPIRLPSLLDQKRIAAFVNVQFSRLDVAGAALNRGLALSEAGKGGLLRAAFSGQLTRESISV